MTQGQSYCLLILTKLSTDGRSIVVMIARIVRYLSGFSLSQQINSSYLKKQDKLISPTCLQQSGQQAASRGPDTQ